MRNDIRISEMKGCKETVKFFLAVLLAHSFVSCIGKRNIAHIDFNSLAKAGMKLGIEIAENDNHALFLEAAQWVGTPYKYGGNTKDGIDCSGLTCRIYERVYGIRLPRSSEQQYRTATHINTQKKSMKQGDLMFFRSSKSGNKCSHVGIYLKNKLFIHCSSSRGVIVERIDGVYWNDKWIGSSH